MFKHELRGLLYEMYECSLYRRKLVASSGFCGWTA